MVSLEEQMAQCNRDVSESAAEAQGIGKTTRGQGHCTGMDLGPRVRHSLERAQRPHGGTMVQSWRRCGCNLDEGPEGNKA